MMRGRARGGRAPEGTSDGAIADRDGLRRLLVVEDDVLIAGTWQRLLESYSVDVVIAPTFYQAWAILQPDAWRNAPFRYVFLDLLLPDGDGADLLPLVAALDPRPGVAVVSGHLDARRALGLNGRCVIALPKPLDRETLLAVLSLMDSQPPIDGVLFEFARVHGLSGQEQNLLSIASRGLSNDEAAESLGCSSATIRSYWARIFKKVGCNNARDVVGRLLFFALAEPKWNGGPPLDPSRVERSSKRPLTGRPRA